MAGWPKEALDRFAADDLAVRARAPNCDANGFAEHWGRVMVEQRRVVRDVCGRDDFQRAMVLAAPELVDRWRGLPPVEATTKARHLRLERTALAYLLRASGRPTPQGAWSAATMATVDGGAPFQADGPVAICAGRAAVSLRVVAALTAALAGYDRYRLGYRLRLDPTLHPDTAGGWAHIGTAGRVEHLAPHAFTDAVVAHFADGRCEPIEPLLDAIAARSGAGHQVRAMLDAAAGALIECGVLRSGLALPARAVYPRAVMREVVAQLVEPDRSRWVDALSRIDPALDELEVLGSLSPARTASLVTLIRAEVAALWSAAGVRAGADAGRDVRWSHQRCAAARRVDMGRA